MLISGAASCVYNEVGGAGQTLIDLSDTSITVATRHFSDFLIAAIAETELQAKIVTGFKELSIDDLTEGNVVVRVSHSTINYKDALAATGKGKILRRYPLNGGIDLAGVVTSSEDADFQPGTSVLVNGCGLSETVDGGYSVMG